MASTSTGIPDLSLLIQDLLSESLLPSTTPALISYHVSTAQPAGLTRLTDVLSSSYALWGRAVEQPHTTLDWKPATEIFDALRNGVVYRSTQLVQANETGYLGRRAFAQAIDAMHQGLLVQPVNPFVRLLVSSAVLSGIQTIKARKDKLYVGTRAILGAAEQNVLDAWSLIEQRKVLRGSAGDWSGQITDSILKHDAHLLSCWIAAQTFPAFSVDRLATGPVSYLLNHLAYAFSCAFANGLAFAGLASDIIDEASSGKLHWISPSPSSDLLAALLNSPLHQNLGPLARAIGRCVEASPRNAVAEEEVRSLLRLLLRLSDRLHRDWASTRWAEATENDLSADTAQRNEPWQLLKAFLFSQTLVLSSLLLVVSPPAGRDPTAMQKELACSALHSLQNSYFVTLEFGRDGFQAWTDLWSGLVHVVKGSLDYSALAMRTLEPRQMTAQDESKLRRSCRLYYLNVGEHLSGDLTTAYVEDRLLQFAKPSLTDHTHIDLFESAHSVVLSLFASGHDVAIKLAPWYTELLLSERDHLTIPQIRLAFSTLIRSVSSKDDALVWWALLQIIGAIDATPLDKPVIAAGVPLQDDEQAGRPPGSSSKGDNQLQLPKTAFSPGSAFTSKLLSNTSAAAADEQQHHAANAKGDSEDDARGEDDKTTLSAATDLAPFEQVAHRSKRGKLLILLIDQCANVNLILFRTLLDHVTRLVSVENERAAWARVVFESLSRGLDNVKREEGNKWWMDNSARLYGLRVETEEEEESQSTDAALHATA